MMKALHEALLQHPHTLSSLSQKLNESEESIQKNLLVLLKMKRVKQKSFKTSCKRNTVRIFYNMGVKSCGADALPAKPVQLHTNSPVIQATDTCNSIITRDNSRAPPRVTDLLIKSNSLTISKISEKSVTVNKNKLEPQNENSEPKIFQTLTESYSSDVHKQKPNRQETIVPSKKGKRRKFVVPRFNNTEDKVPVIHSNKIRKTNSSKRFKPPRMQPINKQSREKPKSKSKDSDPAQLRMLIKKWTEACQDALAALVKEVPERNLTLKQLIDKFGIPSEKVLYDHESEEFLNVEKNLDKLLVLRSDI